MPNALHTSLSVLLGPLCLAAPSLGLSPAVPSDVVCERGHAQGSKDDAKELAGQFRSELDAVAALATKRKWQDALTSLDKLLAAHEGREWAFAARSEVVRLDRICRFGLQARPIQNRDLIRAKILRLNMRTGSIKLRYAEGRAFDDFDIPKAPSEGGRTIRLPGKHGEVIELPRIPTRRGNRRSQLRVHPAVFRDIKITATGTGYSFARFLVAMSDDGYYECVVGTPPKGAGVYFPTSVTLHRGSESQSIVSKHWGSNEAKSKKRWPIKMGEKFRILIRVGKTISIKYKNKILASFPNKLGRSGGFAFDVNSLRTLEIDGRFDPAWLQNKRDAAMQEQRAAFDKTYDARKSLPAWLFALARGSAKPEHGASKKKREKKGYPGKLSQEDIPRFNKLIDALNKKNYRTLLFRIAALPETGISQGIRDWLSAHAYHGLESAKGCLEHAERLRAAHPDFADGHLLAAMAHARQLATDKAMAALDDARRVDPSDVKVYDAAVRLAMRSGLGRTAARWLEDARRAGIEVAEARKLETGVRKLLHGPEWSKRYRVENDNYTIESNIDKKICRDAAKVLDTALAFYRRDLGWRSPQATATKQVQEASGQSVEDGVDQRFRVYLFAGKKGFENYQQSFGATPVHNPAGLFDPMLRQLLIWNLPSRTELFRTVRHEGFHQYLNRALPNAPTWLNEGLAEYYERSKYELGRPQLGAPHPAHLALLSRRGAVPQVAKLMRMSRKRFYANAHINYARAWALVHFLRRGQKRWRPVFDRLVAALRDGNSQSEAVDLALKGVNTQHMHDEWRAHLKILAGK